MTLELAAAEADIEERQNEELLTGNQRILQLEETILAAIRER